MTAKARPAGTVYHGTDSVSAASLEARGLDAEAWVAAAGDGGPDGKGFSVTIDRVVAQWWAQARAGQRGTPTGVVLEADAPSLPLRSGSPGEWTDLDEWFIAVEDFAQAGPGVFRTRGVFPALAGLP